MCRKITTLSMELITLSQKNFQSVVETAAKIIKRGGILIAPTDTVYGIVANALDKDAIDKVYSAKGRDKNKPLPIFVKNMAMAKKLARIPATKNRFLEENWPGKVTVVLDKKPDIKIHGTSGNKIALRVPFYNFINSLIETLNVPLCGTSANISGKPASTKIDEVLEQFSGSIFQPEAAINAGDLPESRPSIIVDFTGDRPISIRK
jgi:L-threonylcarbamoyladenylate synthase